MAYALHGDVSNFMSIPAFTTNTNPTSTVVTASIALAQKRLDIFIGADTISTDGKLHAVCMMVRRMIQSGRVYLLQNEDTRTESEDLIFPAVRKLIDEERADSGEIAIVVSNHPDTQTIDDPDNFV